MAVGDRLRNIFRPKETSILNVPARINFNTATNSDQFTQGSGTTQSGVLLQQIQPEVSTVTERDQIQQQLNYYGTNPNFRHHVSTSNSKANYDVFASLLKRIARIKAHRPNAKIIKSYFFDPSTERMEYGLFVEMKGVSAKSEGHDLPQYIHDNHPTIDVIYIGKIQSIPKYTSEEWDWVRDSLTGEFLTMDPDYTKPKAPAGTGVAAPLSSMSGGY